MNRSRILTSLVCSMLATGFVALGFSSLADKFDPVSHQAVELTGMEVASSAMPCLPTVGEDPRRLDVA